MDHDGQHSMNILFEIANCLGTYSSSKRRSFRKQKRHRRCNCSLSNESLRRRLINEDWNRQAQQGAREKVVIIHPDDRKSDLTRCLSALNEDESSGHFSLSVTVIAIIHQFIISMLGICWLLRGFENRTVLKIWTETPPISQLSTACLINPICWVDAHILTHSRLFSHR